MQAREGRLRTCLKHLAILMLALAMPGIATASTVPVADDFDAAIESLCTQRVVMLGEDAGCIAIRRSAAEHAPPYRRHRRTPCPFPPS